jgi:hypothetical protein
MKTLKFKLNQHLTQLAKENCYDLTIFENGNILLQPAWHFAQFDVDFIQQCFADHDFLKQNLIKVKFLIKGLQTRCVVHDIITENLSGTKFEIVYE